MHSCFVHVSCAVNALPFRCFFFLWRNMEEPSAIIIITIKLLNFAINYAFTACSFQCCSSHDWNCEATSVHYRRDGIGYSDSEFTPYTHKILLKKQRVFFFTNCATTNLTEKKIVQVLPPGVAKTYRMTIKWQQYMKVAWAVACTFPLWANKSIVTPKAQSGLTSQITTWLF